MTEQSSVWLISPGMKDQALIDQALKVRQIVAPLQLPQQTYRVA